MTKLYYFEFLLHQDHEGRRKEEGEGSRERGREEDRQREGTTHSMLCVASHNILIKHNDSVVRGLCASCPFRQAGTQWLGAGVQGWGLQSWEAVC